ncbi:ABC transporter ATP-binding protein [Boudabousia marimammalium]|uniref:Fatty acid ABC transporter ATP-binding/permease protein n=1 Tax=Boudabousia marimammalium TaxID=156892 RepID=A0A1Q5PME3_9ACTO|nr:ABC transporter ATP-binding protein [Boudabousia marimammalium]OKL48728.1 hypothetical protein BM477_05910 [Boudabousia marimammalium]
MRGDLQKPSGGFKEFRGIMRRLAQNMRPERTGLIWFFILSLASIAMSSVAPMILGNATNLVFEGVFNQKAALGTTKEQLIAQYEADGQSQISQMLSAMDLHPGALFDWSGLLWLLGVVAVLYLLSALILFFSGLLARYAVLRTENRLRQKVQRKIDKLTLSYLDDSSRGDLLSRVTNDIDNVKDTLMQVFVQLVPSMISLVAMLSMMFWMSWSLALLTIIIIPLAILLGRVLLGRAKPHFKERWKATGDVSNVVEENFTGQEVVTLYGLQDNFNDQFAEANDRVQHATFMSQFLSGIMWPLMSMLANLAYVLVAVAGGFYVAHGRMTLGAVQAFIQYSRNFTQPLSGLAQMAQVLQSGAASAERIFSFLDAPELSYDVRSAELKAAPEATPTHLGTSPKETPVVTFQDVTFSYEPGKPVITGLNLSVKKGQTVAIVGPTGAGKTTLVNLLMRFYEIDSGAIYVNGVNTLDIPRDELRAQMGMVLQETWLFNGTLQENVQFGKTDATDEEVQAATKATSVDHIIRAMPDGYHTMIDDEGNGISQGEKQLLTIARAFLSDPSILILDEATSSVDTRTEVLVQRAMNQLRSGRTSFVIAHRLSTIRDADLIVVMENGNVVEQGTHRELMAAHGAYRRLHDAQLTAGTDADEGGALLD